MNSNLEDTHLKQPQLITTNVEADKFNNNLRDADLESETCQFACRDCLKLKSHGCFIGEFDVAAGYTAYSTRTNKFCNICNDIYPVKYLNYDYTWGSHRYKSPFATTGRSGFVCETCFVGYTSDPGPFYPVNRPNKST